MVQGKGIWQRILCLWLPLFGFLVFGTMLAYPLAP